MIPWYISYHIKTFKQKPLVKLEYMEQSPLLEPLLPQKDKKVMDKYIGGSLVMVGIAIGFVGGMKVKEKHNVIGETFAGTVVDTDKEVSFDPRYDYHYFVVIERNSDGWRKKFKVSEEEYLNCKPESKVVVDLYSGKLESDISDRYLKNAQM